MKRLQNKKINSQIVFVILVLTSIILLIINFIPTSITNTGLTTDFTVALSSDYSVYVNQSDPNMNYYGSYPTRLIGNSCETYLHFNLESLPQEPGDLYFSLYMYDFYGNGPVDYVEINIISIEESWNASELTWNNKPEHSEIINTVNISDIVQGPFIQYYNFQNTVDLTGFYDKSAFGEFNLCINITKNNENLNNTNVRLSPRLLWNYEIVILSYTNLISTFIIISMLIGTIYFLRKDIYRCHNCGARKVHTEIVCYACETSFERDLRIKRSDYQLVLIVLWIFVFIEGFYLILLASFPFIYLLYPFLFLFPIPWIILFYKIIKKRIKLYKKVKL